MTEYSRKDEIIADLTAGIAQLTSSAEWKAWLGRSESVPPLQRPEHAAYSPTVPRCRPTLPGSTPGAGWVAWCAKAIRA